MGSMVLFVIELLSLFFSIFWAVYEYFQYLYRYWEKKGVPFLEPSFPKGNNPFFLPKSSTFAGEAKLWYDELKKQGHKFGGVYSFSRPVLVLVDPDYIKDILSKDFQYFVNRDFYVNEEHDPIGTHLFNITDKGWKSLRQKLTPTFTSGKMKIMFNTVVNCSNNMIDFMEKSDRLGDDINIREVLASFTTDVIDSVAFGIDCNSFKDTHAEFRKEGREIFNMTLILYLKTLLSRSFPNLCRKIGMRQGKQSSKVFFAKAIKQSVEHRVKNNIRRPDFLQLLIDMNNESKDKDNSFSFEQIVANCVLFFVAGFDTSSTVMTYTLYELARNPDIQERVREEINEVLTKHKGEITYDAVQEMIYLKQVMDETMRIYPPLLAVARICTKEYQLRNTTIFIEKGTPVVISTIGLGRDPEYFPDPLKFDPDRFTPDKVASRHSFIHIPFGEGPRNCIGLRFGVMQAVVGLVQILTKFRLTISPKTEMPLEYDIALFLLKETKTLYLKAQKI